MKVSDIIADFLQEKGIRHVFGIVGAGNAHIFDAIHRKGYTQIICMHHEQSLCMAMQAYYRVSGIITAAIVTTGAGSTNAVTGVVGAWMDSIPGLVISGNENSKFTTEPNRLRIWGVQGYDSVHMVNKVTKYAKRVIDANSVLYELEKAYAYTSQRRPGPCWIDIPMNIQAAPIEIAQLNHFDEEFSEVPAVNANNYLDASTGVEKVLMELKTAKRPLLWLGHGIRLANAVNLIEPLLEKLQCPALLSWAGIDMVPSAHPLIAGRAGVYGQRAANFILQNCDFLLTIGTRLAIPQIGYDLSEFARAAKIAVVDIDPLEINKHKERVNYPILADAKKFMTELLEHLEKESIGYKQEWLQRCNNYKTKYPIIGPEHADEDGYINSYPFMQRLSEYFSPEQIVVTDMGTALLSGHQVLSFKKGQRLMTSTGLGEMGFGLPGAIGAAIAAEHKQVICLNCDGGMMLNLQELQTIVHHQLPIKLFIFNNDGYLMIKHTQKALFAGRYTGTDKSSGVSCPNFSDLAKAFGIPAYTIKTWEDFAQVMPKVQNEKGPVICDVFTHPEQLFVPKLSLAPQKDGSIVSPPLEDLSPLLPRDELGQNMIIGMHPKSENL